MSFVKDLNTPLLKLSPTDNFTLADACTGVHVFGGIGSGKTSGSGKMLAGAFLRAGFGGVVTAVKPQTVPQWQKDLASEHHRSKSIIVFDENEGFNFIAHALAQHGVEGIGTVVEYILRVTEAAKTASSASSQKGGDAFWMDATRQFLRYTIPPLYAATGTVTIPDIIRFISSAPTSRREVTDAEWQRSASMYQTMDKATRNPVVPMSRDAMEASLHYWAQEYPAIPEKTRGNITISITSALDRFRHGRLKQAFCGKTTIVPEMALHGAVIILAMPTLTWNEDGVIAQQLFKYAFQRCVLNRNSLAPKHRESQSYLRD